MSNARRGWVDWALTAAVVVAVAVGLWSMHSLNRSAELRRREESARVEGALLLREYDEAERLAAWGLEIAIQRREADTIRMAYATLDRIMLRAEPDADRSPPANIGVAATVDRFIQRMNAARAPAEQTEAPAPVSANLSALTALAK